ncbi:MAG TPA: DUF4412 domain-containing protein [Chthoniobacteraceae bacterium]|nr:DUF4412 domain-containing protein [Chthoniobacteraceae bacterium]
MRLIFVILSVLPLPSLADLTVVQKSEGAMNSGQLTLRIKGDKARVDLSAQITMVTDLTTGDCVSLNHTARTMVRIPGVETAKLREISAGLKPGSEPPKLTPTQRKEKVENRDCQVFTWKVGELEVTDWIDPTYTDWKPVLAELQRFQNAGAAHAAQPLMPPLDQFPGMVLKREMNHKGTKTTSTLVSVKMDALDAKVFDLPADYKEQPAPKLPESPAPK